MSVKPCLLLLLLGISGCSEASAASCALPTGTFRVTGVARAGTCGPYDRLVQFGSEGYLSGPCWGQATPVSPGSCQMYIRRECYLYSDDWSQFRGAEILRGTFLMSSSSYLRGDGTLDMYGRDYIATCRSVYDLTWWR